MGVLSPGTWRAEEKPRPRVASLLVPPVLPPALLPGPHWAQAQRSSLTRFFLVHRTKPTHTTVNCWFCAQDTVVPYGNRNCWDCPHCEQYNGFQEVRRPQPLSSRPAPSPQPGGPR